MRTGRIGDSLRRARGRRVLVIAAVSSVLFHVLLAILALIGPWWEHGPSMKKGEPLIVDITPEKPEEPAPRGNPNRAVTAAPREAPPPAPKAPPAPKPAPVAAPPRPAPPAPAAPATPPAPAPPQQQVAKAPEPPPAPKEPEPAPAPTPAPAAPTEPVVREAPKPTPRGPSEATPGPAQPPNQRVARSSGGIDLPAAMLRRPPGGGLQGGRGGVEGEPIPLDTPDPKYQDYFRILRERIQAKWSYPREAGDRGIGGELIIEFHIGKDGRLAYLEVRRASGVDVLDEYAVNAVKLAQPFPPVPDNIANIPANRGLAINGKFVYHITDNSLVKQFTR
jgi:TonB family protein